MISRAIYARRSRHIPALMLITCLSVPSNAPASKQVTKDSPPLGMDLSVSDVTDERGRFVLAVRTWSREGLGDAHASVRIMVRGGAEVVAGDTIATIPAKSGFWRITLRKKNSRPVVINGHLRIRGKDSGEHYGSRDILRLRIEDRKVVVLKQKTVHALSVKGGRIHWYRRSSE